MFDLSCFKHRYTKIHLGYHGYFLQKLSSNFFFNKDISRGYCCTAADCITVRVCIQVYCTTGTHTPYIYTQAVNLFKHYTVCTPQRQCVKSDIALSEQKKHEPLRLELQTWSSRGNPEFLIKNPRAKQIYSELTETSSFIKNLIFLRHFPMNTRILRISRTWKLQAFKKNSSLIGLGIPALVFLNCLKIRLQVLTRPEVF